MKPPSESDGPWPWLRKRFATTRWSLVRRVTKGSGGRETDASDFCGLYWQPLYSFLRSRGHDSENARDHVQTFFVKVIHRDWLRTVDPERGRLRSFLLTLLTRHISAERAHQGTVRRAAGAQHVSFDQLSVEAVWQAEAANAISPDDVFRRALARKLVDAGLDALRERYAGLGRSELLEALLPALEGPLIDEGYAEVAERLGLSEGSVRTSVVRMRERFRECLFAAAEIALCLPQGPALEEELREIFG